MVALALCIPGGLVAYLVLNKYVDFDSSFADYIYQEGNRALFKKADRLKYSGALSDAGDAYLEILGRQLPEQDRWYATNQLTYILLTIHQDNIPRTHLDRFEKMGASLPLEASGAYGDYYFNKGMLAFFQDDWVHADSFLHLALTGYRAVYPGEHLRIAQCLVWLGWTSLSLSPDISQVYLPYAYELYQRNRAWNLGRAECELGMARIEQMQRNYNPGIQYCEIALRHLATDTLAYANLIARILCTRGMLQIKEGKTDLAQRDLQESLRLALKAGSPYAEEVFKILIQNDLSQKKTEAEIFSRIHELEVFQQGRTPRYAFANWFKGWYYHKQGDWDAAIEHFEQFLEEVPDVQKIRVDILDNTYFPLIVAYKNKGWYDKAVYYGLKEWDLGKTETGEGNSYTTVNDLIYPNIEKCSEYDLGIIALLGRIFLNKYYTSKRESDLAQSSVFFSGCDSIYFSKFREKDEGTLLKMQSEIVDSCYPYALEASFAHYTYARKRKWLDDAFRFCEREKAGIMYQEMRLSQAKVDSAYNVLKDTVADLNIIINRFNLIQESGKALSFEEQNEMRDARQKRDNLTKRLRSRAEKEKENTELAIPTIKQVQEHLRKKDAVIHYGIGPAKLHILFITRDTVLFRQAEDANLIREKVQEFRGLLSTHDSKPEDYALTANWLYEQLLGPLQPYLNKYSNLLLIPDGDLHLIPFEALVEPFQLVPGKKTDYFSLPYLLRRFSVSYSPSWMVHLKNINQISFPLTDPRIGVWADTTFQVWQEEISGIKTAWTDRRVEVAIGPDCSLKNFKSNFDRFDILHLMLHGQTNPENPFDFKVLFGLEEPNWLYGYEAQGYRFTRPKMIVLAVCETALGKNGTGEGAKTLSRSFLQAGIPWVIASLGKIDEGATEKILRTFYARIARADRTLFPPDALREAKLAYIIREKQGFPIHPHYWAGLIVQH